MGWRAWWGRRCAGASVMHGVLGHAVDRLVDVALLDAAEAIGVGVAGQAAVVARFLLALNTLASMGPDTLAPQGRSARFEATPVGALS